MTTEARKTYKDNVPDWERALRSRLTYERGILRGMKRRVKENLNILQSRKDLRPDEEWLRKYDVRMDRAHIKAQKKIIQTLKNGLPQCRPAGVMVKCPFCGAKQSAFLTLKNGKGEGVTVKALYALEDAFDEFMAVGCRNCGARIAYPKYDDTTIQDLVDVWNRRA